MGKSPPQEQKPSTGAGVQGAAPPEKRDTTFKNFYETIFCRHELRFFARVKSGGGRNWKKSKKFKSILKMWERLGKLLEKI